MESKKGRERKKGKRKKKRTKWISVWCFLLWRKTKSVPRAVLFVCLRFYTQTSDLNSKLSNITHIMLAHKYACT